MSLVDINITRILLTISLVGVLSFIFLRRIPKAKARFSRLPPGPPGLPLLGSLPFLEPNLHRYFARLARTYGPVLSLRLGSKLCVVVSSPSAAREILKDQDAVFANHDIPAAIHFAMGNSPDLLWSPNGSQWRMLRKIAVSHVLNVASIEATAPLRRREVRRAVTAVWEKGRSGLAVDVRDLMFQTTLNTTTSMLWGERVTGDGNWMGFRQAIEGVLDLMLAPNVADYFPMVAPLDPQGLGRRVRRHMNWLHRYMDGILERRKKAMKEGEKSSDVLELIMEMMERGGPLLAAFTSTDLKNFLSCKMVRGRGGGFRDTSSRSSGPSTPTPTRPYVGQVVQGSFLDCQVTRTLVRDLKDAFDHPYTRWSDIPAAVREGLWARFESRWSWPNEETSVVRTAWEKTSTRRLTQTLNIARKEALKRANSDCIRDTRGHGPSWLSDVVWDGLILHWSSEEWQSASRRASANRRTSKGGEITKHSGGSITFAEHQRRLEVELQRPATQTEIFRHTHTKKGSTDYIDERSKAVAEKYEAAMLSRYGSSGATQHEFDRSAWLEATGGLTKGRVYGFGGRVDEGSWVPSTSQRPSNSKYQGKPVTREEVKEIFRELLEEMKREGALPHQPSRDEHDESDDDDDDDADDAVDLQ